MLNFKLKVQAILKSFLLYGGLYLLAFLVFSILNMRFSYDDYYFIHALDNQNIVEFLSTRYQHWSSRLFTELLVVIFVGHPILFLIAESLVASIIYNSIRILCDVSDLSGCVLLQFTLLLYPFQDLYSAGWYTTHINYLWPLAALLYVCSYIKDKLSYHKQIPKIKKVLQQMLLVPSLLLTLNMEQSAGILFLLTTILIINKIYHNEHIHFAVIIIDFLTISSIIYILTCPGNAERATADITSWMPHFDEYKLPLKLYNGLLIGVDLFLRNKILFLILSILTLNNINGNTRVLIKILDFVPTLIIASLFFAQIVLNIDPTHFNNTLAAILFLCFLVIVLLQVWIFFIRNNNSPLWNSILPIGIASILIIGLSATAFASGRRVGIYFLFSVILLTFQIWNSSPNRILKKTFYFFIIALSSFNFLVETIW